MQLLKGFGAHRGVRLVTLAVVVLIGNSQLASAQNMRGRGPFAGLFGMGPRATNSQSLDFRGSAFGVWQDVIFGSDFDPSLIDPTFKKSETLGVGIASLQYVFDHHAEHSKGRGAMVELTHLLGQSQCLRMGV